MSMRRVARGSTLAVPPHMVVISIPKFPKRNIHGQSIPPIAFCVRTTPVVTW